MKIVLKAFAWLVGIVIVLNVLGIAFGILTGPFKLASTVVNQAGKTATGVVEQVINPEHALRTYRELHGYYTAVEAKKGQIALAKQAVEMASEGRKDARRTELVGVQQGCINMVEKYNELTRRTDTRIYKNPEKFLPDSWTGPRQILPETFDQSVCY